MPRNPIILLGCLLVITAAVAITSVPSPATAKAPSFQVQTLGGEQLSLQDLIGERHLLLAFWTTWCPSCRQTMPEVDQIASDYSRSDLAVLGINAGWNDSAQRADRFKKEYGLDFPVVFDKASRVSKKYRIRGVPTLFLIDPQGNIRFQGYSVNMELLRLLEKLDSE